MSRSIRPLVLLVFALLACDEKEAHPPRVETDAAALARFATLPVAPESVIFEVFPIGDARSTAPGPTDRRLYAVLRFSEAGAAELAGRLEPKAAPLSIEVRPWFPPELQQALEPDGQGARRRLSGKQFSAASFEKMPYRAGALVQLGDAPVFFLTLQTM